MYVRQRGKEQRENNGMKEYRSGIYCVSIRTALFVGANRILTVPLCVFR